MQTEEKIISYIAPTKQIVEDGDVSTIKHVAAYCRVSTNNKDQINSYENQKSKYTDMIMSKPGWELVGIYADKGISGTSTKNRTEFKKMIRHCRQGRINMIIVKSVSRFARNNLDTLNYTRKLREIGVDVYFEEQNIHSIDPSSDFMISLHGSLAQSESESLSANVKWGKLQSIKSGKVAFSCKNFLGYIQGTDGQPTIVEDEAEVIRSIYADFLSGKSSREICKELESRQILSPAGNEHWSSASVLSILKNVKYKGDVITNMTYTVDPISKKKKINNGEVGQYYIKNNHPAIIDENTFARVQEELHRRANLDKKVEKVTVTEHGRFDGRYALSELLFCGDCGSHYRRRIWGHNGQSKPVWRCCKRVYYGKKYCSNSVSIPENSIHDAIMNAIRVNALDVSESLDSLREIINAGLEENKIARRIMELDEAINDLKSETEIMMKTLSTDLEHDFDEDRFVELRTQLAESEIERKKLLYSGGNSVMTEDRLNELDRTLRILLHQPHTYDDALIRQLITRITVLGKSEIKIDFVGGNSVKQELRL